jgi:predicted metal-dependent phosphoesterase TrpH
VTSGPRASVDLHLHTTASDGRCSPTALVEQAAAGGVTVIAVTDHDTTAAVHEVQAAARECGIEAITGIEITAVEAGRDIHVLGYFVDPLDGPLAEFLVRQRASRIARVETIAEKLAALGMSIDVAAVIADAQGRSGRSVGRPQVARAMVASGHVKDIKEAFDRFLAQDGPVFVPRTGASPEEVVAIIHAAGGLASLAHPGRTRIDARIRDLRDAGLDAIEVFHSDHDSGLVERYAEMSRTLDLLVTGGSDFHGDPGHGLTPGSAGLPAAEWSRLSAARDRHARP